jgi:hypothetical protein
MSEKYTFETFRNESGLTFKKIESEHSRTYLYPDGQEILIHEPVALNVSKNGHRVFDAYGQSHYIQGGWRHITWTVKDGKPHFVA